MDGDTFKSFHLVKDEFDLDIQDFYRYLQLRHFFESETKGKDMREGLEVVGVFTNAYKMAPSKVVSKL